MVSTCEDVLGLDRKAWNCVSITSESSSQDDRFNGDTLFFFTFVVFFLDFEKLVLNIANYFCNDIRMLLDIRNKENASNIYRGQEL